MRQKVFLNTFFSGLWKKENAFDKVFALDGEEYRLVKNRRTFRVTIDGKGFFVKTHSAIGWREIFKNLFQFKLPVISARNEFLALDKLHKLDIPTMTAAAFGERYANPAARESFVITEELRDVETLEELGRKEIEPLLRLKLLRAVAASAGKMHRAGINHCDCYICHYMMDMKTVNDPEVRVYVIDLHRARIRKKVPLHYHVKDVAGLFFSAIPAGLTKREALRFIREYSQRPLKAELSENRRFWEAVRKAALKLYRKEYNAESPLQF